MTRIFSRVIVVLLTVLLIVGGVTLLPSCREGDGEQVTLAKMDIIDATHLFIAPGSGNKLFKITEEGYVQEVTYEDENGNNVTTETEPVAIYDVNSEYVIVCFGVNDIDISEGYLVRKSDGAVFSLESAGFPLPQHGMDFDVLNGECIFTDSSSNIYYSTDSGMGREIIKLNTENMDSITKTVYSPSGDAVTYFVVDNDGNAAYWGHPEGDFTRGFNRIRTAEGSIYDGLFDDTARQWLGVDDMIYCFSFELGEWLTYCLIEKVSVNATTGVPVRSEYSAFNYSGNAGSALFLVYKLELQDRVIFVPSFFSDEPFIFEVYNPTNSPRSLNMTACFDLKRMYSGVASDNFYYLHGSNNFSDSVLIKVDPTDDSYTILSFSTDEYYLYTMSTTTADELIFNALRMSDGVNVIGKFDVSGNMTILDEESDVEMVVLERIQ